MLTRIWNRLRSVVAPALLLFAVNACGDASYGAFDSTLGATPGGAQDIGKARAVINGGGIPTAEDFTPEGLYSEHDLVIANAPPCGKTLCVNTAAGLEFGIDDEKRDIFVQLGMQSSISATEFKRKPLNLGIVIDTSGSMSGLLDELKAALRTLVDNLRPDDRVAIIEFASSANTIISSTLVSDKDELHSAIDDLATGGSTSLEEGMMLGYGEIDDFVDPKTLSRLMVFTDAMPNVGATDVGSFQSMVKAAAAHDIGFTFFGFGASFDAAFVDQISHLRGGNYRFVGPKDVKQIFEEELDFLVTPLAYDLRVSTKAAEGTALATVYGVPGAEDHVNGALIDVTTVFLSKRKGGIVLRFDGTNVESLTNGSMYDIGSVDLSYETPEGVVEMDTLPMTLPFVTPPLATEALYPNASMKRTVAVTNQYLVMKTVCEAYHTGSFDPTDAMARLDKVIAALTDADSTLNDPNLKREIALLQKLKSNLGLSGGAP
ncbi:MAG: VWA domain-containing protein [Polyangiaceae bacterium]|nr:VWA domain-containing protein [Polyangiaceae bacterium]